MSFRTIEVEVEKGRIQLTGDSKLPDRARGWLTLIEENKPQSNGLDGLKRFLESPDIPINREQLREIMELDYYDQ